MIIDNDNNNDVIFLPASTSAEEFNTKAVTATEATTEADTEADTETDTDTDTDTNTNTNTNANNILPN